jgi:peptide/nickel transport system substrate-binding protein
MRRRHGMEARANEPQQPDQSSSVTSETPPSESRLSRRTFVQAVAAGAAVAAGTRIGWSQGSRSNTLIFPVNGDPFRWPFLPAIPNILFNKTVYSSLVKYDLDGVTPVSDLAESWTTADAKVWTFKLRRDVKWHDGKPFSADDVKFTFDAMLDPKVNKTNVGILVTLKRTEVVDPHTVRLVFDDPVASLPIGLGWLIFILPKHLLAGTDLNKPAEFLKNPVGTGPFRFKEFVSGSHTTVVPNPDFYGEKAKIDAVIFKQIPDLNSQVAQVLTGELDVAFPEVQQLDALKSATNVEIMYTTPMQFFFIGLNNRNPLFADRRVRHALAHAVDRQAIVDNVVQGKAALATGPIHPTIKWAYHPNVKRYAYDPSRAKELLAEAGWTPGSGGTVTKDGKPFSFTITSTSGNTTRQQINLALQQYLRRIGVETKLEFLEPNLFDQKLFSFNFDCLMHFSQLQPDPDLINYFGTDKRNNYWGYTNPEVDRLLTEGRATTDQSKRAAAYRRFQEILAEDLPIIFFYHPQEIDVVNRRVQNYPRLDFRNATLYLNRVTLAR